MSVRVVKAPEAGLWRVERSPSTALFPPTLTYEELDDPSVGNRFDSPDGEYGVKYFCTKREACFGETLARFRPDPALATVDLDDDGMMNRAEVPADWRQSRTSKRVVLTTSEAVADHRFVDVEDFETRLHIEQAVRPLLALRSAAHIDVPEIRGPDRVLTRTISKWVHAQRDELGTRKFAGIRFLSKLNTEWECWALFEGCEFDCVETRAITRTDPELVRIAKLFSINVF
ncbi:MAG: RES family NAD+ phosphorylase [Actinobacteria bacterium]|nr:RES family NAD+ phosphorylase [Actinomycetota bacterium]